MAEKTASDLDSLEKDPRTLLVEEGISILHRWIQDLLREGLHAVAKSFTGQAATQAAIMVDHKAGGIARILRQLSTIPTTQTGWEAAAIRELTKLYCMTWTFLRRERLSTEMDTYLRHRIGWPAQKAPLLETPGIQDQWYCLAAESETDPETSLTTEKVWFFGISTQQFLLFFDYHPKWANPNHGFVLGRAYAGEAVFFPAPTPLRGLFKSELNQIEAAFPAGCHDLGDLPSYRAALLRANPFQEEIPVFLHNIFLVPRKEAFFVRNVTGQYLSLLNQEDSLYSVLASCGGQAVSLFGMNEKDGIRWLTILTSDSRFSSEKHDGIR